MSHESDFFNREVPRRLQIGILRAVVDGCIAAHDAARGGAAEWFNDAIPAHRRLLVEPRLHSLILPKGFSASVGKTPSTHFTRIDSGKIVLTAVTRSFRRSWVAPEPYRETLAKEAQLIFAQMRESAPEESSRLYALLVYGGLHKERLPTLADIVFPTPSGFLAPGAIDLLERFPEVLEAHRPKPVAEPKVALRLVKKADDQEGA